MKTKKIFLIIYLITQSIWAQGNSSTENKSYLPNITPPSPEAFAISEYGKNGVSEFSGKLNISIPLYTFNAGQLSLPVSLNYSGAGVKVNDISTWAGTNWNLSAGGIISRRVNDFADEEISIIRKYINEQHLITNASNTCAEYSQDYYNMCFFADRYDTEVDVFNFNFNGYSGSFFLDENYIPVYIENESDIKIEIVGPETTNLERLRTSKTFVITTPDGIKYYFGGQQTEQTMTFSGHRGNSFLSNTGFYLFKIEHPINGNIEFEYFTATARMSFINKSYNMRYQSASGNAQAPPPPYTQQFFKTQINNPKILSKIKSTSNQMTINFIATVHASHNYISTLNRIEIKNGTHLLKEIDLTHGAKINDIQQLNDYTTATRFFLEKIEFNKNIDTDSNKKEVYLFEYNDPFSLPDRLSNSQDILGYFNGEVNETLIPYNSLISVNQNAAFANRHPNFALASKGTLNKITYPTKGYSLFEYEPTDAKEKIYKTYSGTVEGALISNVPGENASGENVIFTPIYETQEVVFNIASGVTETTDAEFDLAVYQTHHAKRVELKITDVTTNSEPIYIRRSLGMTPTTTTHFFTFVKDHIYAIEFKILNPDGSTTFNQLNASFDVTVMNGYQLIEGFGVRLKRQSDFGSNQNPTNSKRYYYRTIKPSENYVLSLPMINYMPEISYAFNTQIIDISNTNSPSFYYFIDIHSEAGNKYANATNNEFYDVVSTSFGGDNFENGGTEKYFFFHNNINQGKVEVTNDGCWNGFMDPLTGVVMEGIFCGLPSTVNTAITAVRDLYKSNETTDMGMYNGKLLGERQYRNINGSLFKISETFNDYDTFAIPIKQGVNFVGKELFGRNEALNHCTPDLTDTPRHALSGCYLGYYLVNSFAFKQRSTLKIEYIEPIPISIYTPLIDSELTFSIYYNPEIAALEAPFKKITTTETYQYGTLKGLPTTITTSTSESGVDKKTVNTYVNTAASLPNIPATQSALYASLLNQNRVATPVQVEQFENTTLLTTQRTLFKKWNNNNNHILPELIQTSKGTNSLEDRAVFGEYDTKGNPTILSLKDGTKTKYFYNVNNQVIMKVENFMTNQNIPMNPTWTNACSFISNYPTANITIFNYDPITNQIVSIVSPNCDTQYYIYDAMHRLKFIKDNAGNIVKEFDQNYKN